jgi:NAD(P)-dependent dehydrogenase (short-subunit alcohol dehydrogenase family)
MKSPTVLITGANRGIGLGLTNQALASGYSVIATCRNPDGARDLWELEHTYTERLKVVALDVADPSSVKGLKDRLPASLVLDMLINNAGLLQGAKASFKETFLDDVEAMLKVNSIAPMRVTQALLPFLEKAPAPIVANMSSKMGSVEDNTSGGYYGYRMSKAALNMFNKSFSIDFPKITSVVLHPGWVKTRMGGESAPTSVWDSTEGLWKVIQGVKPKDTGKFIEYTGELIPW